jgi:hypothetical protein
MTTHGTFRRHILHDALEKHDPTLIPKLPPRASLTAISVVEDGLAAGRGVDGAILKQSLDTTAGQTPE